MPRKPWDNRIELRVPDDPGGSDAYEPQRRRLSEVSLPVIRADVFSDPDNTQRGNVYIGGSQVNATAGAKRGVPLRPERGYTIIDSDLSWWWVAAENAGDAVTVLAEIEV